MEKVIPYGRHLIDDEDIKAVIDVLKSDFLTQGPKVEEFEKALAKRFKAKYAVVFNSGTSALHGLYFAVGLKEGDEFITTPISFVATSNAGLYIGAKPVFIDIEEDTANIDVSRIENHITDRTKLISVVHYGGHPVDLENIKKIAQKHSLKLIEDGCHAMGAKYKDCEIGNLAYSDACVFSFHPVKHITTGEGGAVLTNDEGLYEKLIMFRTHGITKNKSNFINKKEGPWYYEMHYLGYNYRMTDIQAALGISQLKKLDSFVKRRREIANIYNEAFKNNPYFDIPVEREYAYHSYHLYAIRLKDRYKNKKSEIFNALKEEGLGVQVHYIPIYHQPFYRSLGYKDLYLAKAESFYEKEISLPIFPAMTDEDVDYVISKVFEVFRKI
ncbi:MAG: UDP-4-amino-4,6-dideoxy-N-acetyl-beta-L-altrosamine transaminase [Hydrogenobaculum sp.]|nr:MAG: UDP-4-amino-4,6-dideoxy-N-acetyl-beta-L-altrosamine transaminase [Hydrogenobaculum sp.]